nr:unnamed protein product [Callosobruchus chinensis]
MDSIISNDSLYRSESPYEAERQALSKTGEVGRLKKKFEYWEDMYGNITLKRSRSESDINKFFPIPNFGYVDSLRRKYEYPAYSGRGRSRTRRGGVVSPIFLKAEDRFMPHINIISKIASLYAKQSSKSEKERQRSTAELAEILGCPIGEVEKLRDKFDSMEDISLVGHMYTSSPSIRELKDIAPYLAADWASHRYPRYEDNTRSLSSPETSIASRDTSLVRKDRSRPKSTSPAPKPKKPPSPILKQPQKKSRSTDFRQNQKYDPKMHEPVARYQPIDVARYRNGWSGVAKPTVSFKEPEPPLPPPKGLRTDNVEAESPRKYVENEVTIHYRTPVRQEVKGYLSEDELAQRHACTARRVYDEERRKKYLQELQDMNSRRHTDNFTPSQKSPISLNRYDDFDDLAVPTKPRPRSPARELTFRKGDLIYVRRQVDKNWYEGELNAMVGLFPVNYVEIVPYDGAKTTPRKPHEGQARAKFNFLAQTHLELSLARGELVVITRRVDENWFEGKIGGRKGIFPASYVEVLIDPHAGSVAPSKPVASPAAHSLLLNGSAGGKESMGAHQYRALYKYAPQNDDELELLEGDTVYVLEKCDDGWYVGSSERTGAFGTFPGNYVEKI